MKENRTKKVKWNYRRVERIFNYLVDRYGYDEARDILFESCVWKKTDFSGSAALDTIFTAY